MRQAWNSRPSEQPQQRHAEAKKQCPALPAPEVAQIHDQLLVKNNKLDSGPFKGVMGNANGINSLPKTRSLAASR
jgi:hypothetical protein